MLTSGARKRFENLKDKKNLLIIQDACSSYYARKLKDINSTSYSMYINA